MSKSPITPRSESGQTMAEYAVVLAVITFAIVTSFSALAGAMEMAIDRVVDVVRSAI